MKLRVAMIAPPWLPIPPKGYGGIENMLEALVPALLKRGLRVEVFTTGDSTVKATKRHYIYDRGQFGHIHRPQYDTAPIISAHILSALKYILRDGHFDVIHDHNNFLGSLAMAYAGDKLPPVISTLHNPRFTAPGAAMETPPDTALFWDQLAAADNIGYVGISEAQVKTAPAGFRHKILGTVHNGVNLRQFPYTRKKDNYFLTLARHHPEKGQHIAAKACAELGYELRMAGIVADLRTSRQLTMELSNPLSRYRSLSEFRYFSDKILPYLGDKITFIGEVSGKRKLDVIKKARALLFPIQWDEPFGMAPIEALACGTPVIAMARGALPEIIQHGINGFLAKNQTEFKHYMTRIGDIDPAACRASVRQRFSADIMAKNYIKLYRSLVRDR